MKKQLATLTLILLTINVFGQYDNYDKGFKNGYKEGYCYNDFGCMAPIPPITPIPLIGESNDNYQDGYNRGFKKGLENKQANKSNSSGYQSGHGTYSPTPYSYVSQYVPRDLKAMQQSLQQSQDAYDKNEKYINSLIDWIYKLKAATNESEILTALDKYYIKLRTFDNQDLSILGQDIRKVELGIKEEIDKYNTRIKESNPNNATYGYDSNKVNMGKEKSNTLVNNYKLKTEIDSVAYGIGLNLAQSIKKVFSEANIEAIEAGLREGLKGENNISPDLTKKLVDDYFKKK